MNEQTKESKFLDAINKYAEKQKASISTEMEDFKNQRIEQATEQGLQDAYELIQRDISRQKSAIVTEISAKEHELRTRQFKRRQQISDEVFDKARKKLMDFTASADYAEHLKRCAKEVFAVFGEDVSSVSLSEKDLPYAEVLQSIFPKAEVTADSGILIGGFKAYANGILADETLDAKLLDQRAWFNENSGLKVV